MARMGKAFLDILAGTCRVGCELRGKGVTAASDFDNTCSCDAFSAHYTFARHRLFSQSLRLCSWLI